MKTKHFSARRLVLITAAALAGLSLCEFLTFYIFFGFLFQSSALLVSVSYLISFIEGFFPILAATVIFFASEKSTRRTALVALALSTTKTLYALPRYYLYFVSDVFNSLESLLLSAIVSILYVLYTFLQIFICIIILKHAVFKNQSKKNKLMPSPVFSLDDSANFGLVLNVIFIFVIFFAKECFNVISYFIEVGAGYTGEEILTMVISFLLLPIFAFLYYLICAPIKNKILASKSADTKADESTDEVKA